METQIANAETHIDEGPARWAGGKNDITRQDKGQINPGLIAHIPGANNEQKLFAAKQSGRMTRDEWRAFKRDLSNNGMQYPITIFKEKDGTIHIWEGNHRLAAALEMEWSQVPVEIHYFGNSQRAGLVV